jgi:ABC-2 type transport system permease protein
MLRNLFTKTIRDNVRSAIGWVVGAGVLTTWLVAMYPYIRDSDAMQELLEQMPPEMMAAFGMDPATFLTGAGYLSAQMYSFIGPVIMIGFAVGLGVAVTAKEEQEGTLDMLLAAPISRSRVVLSKIAASALLAALIPSVMATVLILANQPLGLEISIQGILAINAGLWLLGMVFAGVATAIGAFMGRPGAARGMAFFAAVLSWFVSVFEPLFDWLELPSKASPFTWYIDKNPMLDLWSTGFWWLLITIIALAIATVWLFSRRDIATEIAVLPETSITPRRSKHVEPRSARLLGSVAGKTVWDKRKTVFLWSAGIASLLLGTFAAWPTMSGNSAALEALVSSMPTEMFAVFGMTDPESLATPAGFISSRAYLNMGPLIMILFCVGGVSALVAKEERTGVLDMVLSNPQPRRSVLVHKMLALAGLTAVIAAILVAVGFAGNQIWDTGLEPMHIIGANVGLMLLGLFFGGMALALWSILGSGGAAIGVTSAFAVISYFLNGLATVVDPIAPFRLISPFFWYLGDTVPLAKGIEPAYALLLLGAVMGTLISLWRFDKRDLAV